MCEGERLQGIGEALEAVVETGGSGETDEGHNRRYLGGDKGATVTGIRKAWRGRWRGRGGDY